MAERSDNFSHAFNGVSLDWDAVFGAGFLNAPAHWLSVYKPCSLDELVRIAREGVTAIPTPVLLPDFIRDLEIVDRYRPAHIAKRGVSRNRAIFALPAPELPHFAMRGGRVLLEMKIEPAEAYVGDADLLMGQRPFSAGQQGFHKLESVLKKYWSGVLSLADFYRCYQKIDAVGGSHWAAKPSAPPRLPRAFFLPEVLIMTPTIGQQHIRIFRRTGLPAEVWQEGGEWSED